MLAQLVEQWAFNPLVTGSNPVRPTKKQGITMTAMGMMSGPMTLMPAYGRLYNTSEEAVEAWKSGSDFKIVGGGYCSIRDLEYLKNHCSTLWIHWNRIDSIRIL